MKQITIYEFLERNSDIIRGNYVAYEPIAGWLVFREKPKCCVYEWFGGNMISDTFNIAPFDGDWKDSLIKVEHKEEE
jgi:hypothetical protein